MHSGPPGGMGAALTPNQSYDKDRPLPPPPGAGADAVDSPRKAEQKNYTQLGEWERSQTVFSGDRADSANRSAPIRRSSYWRENHTDAQPTSIQATSRGTI